MCRCARRVLGWARYHGPVPAAGEVDVEVSELPTVRLDHLSLHLLQQICKPLKRIRVRADPVEVDSLQFHMVGWVQIPVPGISVQAAWSKTSVDEETFDNW